MNLAFESVKNRVCGSPISLQRTELQFCFFGYFIILSRQVVCPGTFSSEERPFCHEKSLSSLGFARVGSGSGRRGW